MVRHKLSMVGYRYVKDSIKYNPDTAKKGRWWWEEGGLRGLGNRKETGLERMKGLQEIK